MLSVGQTVGNYRITRLLGEGGMGQVFEAHQEEIGKRVAIKALHGNLAEHPEAVSRFLNEARAVNVIGHPSLVNIFESGRLPDGAVYIIMEFLEGEPLTHRIQNGGLTIADSMRLTRQVASALQAAHNKGIVHRDLKPDSVSPEENSLNFGGTRGNFRRAQLGTETVSPSMDGASTTYVPERYYTAVPILSERAKAALSRLQANLDEMERLANEARALMAEIQQDGETCSPSVRERTRDALRQLRTSPEHSPSKLRSAG